MSYVVPGDDADVLAVVEAERGGAHDARHGLQRQGLDHTGKALPRRMITFDLSSLLDHPHCIQPQFIPDYESTASASHRDLHPLRLPDHPL